MSSGEMKNGINRYLSKVKGRLTYAPPGEVSYRFLNERAGDNITVMDYKADPKGINESTTAFIKAGPNSYVPRGNYLVDTALVPVSQYTGPGVIIPLKTGVPISLTSDENRSPSIQAKMLEPFFGWNNGTTDTSIFAGARNALQGVSIVGHGDSTDVFMTIRVSGSSWQTSERCRIVRTSMREDGAVVNNLEWSTPINIAHGYDIGVHRVNGETYIYSSQTVQTGMIGTNGGKGYSKTKWRGTATNQSDVVSYALWGQPGSGHPYELYNRAGVTVSSDGRYLLMAPAPALYAANRELFVYDLIAVEKMANKLDARPLYKFELPSTTAQGSNVLQGLTCNGSEIAVVLGGTDPFGERYIITLRLDGTVKSKITFDGATAAYGLNGLLNNPTHGFPWRFEPEGICHYKDGYVVTISEGWLATAPVVSRKGKNWACISASSTVGVPPSNGSYWVRTTKPATRGEWDKTADYANDAAFSNERKTLYYVGPSGMYPLETGTSNGIADTPDLAMVSTGQGANATSVGFQYRSSYTIKARSDREDLSYNAMEYDTSSRFKLYDQRDDSDNNIFGSIQGNYLSDLKALIIRGEGTTTGSSAMVRYHSQMCPLYPGAVVEFTGVLGSRRRLTDESGVTTFNSSATYTPLNASRPDSGRTISVFRGTDDIGGISQNTAAVKFQSSDGYNVRFGTRSSSGVDVDQWQLTTSTSNLHPVLDNVSSLGTASARVSEIVSANPVTSTSDKRLKTNITPIDEALLDAWSLINWVGFQFRDAVTTKGEDGARIHYGLIAQDLKETLEAPGLDPFKYSLLCYDKWDDTWEEWGDLYETLPATYSTTIVGQDGNPLLISAESKVLVKSAGRQLVIPAGDRYGIRYTEGLAVEAAYLRRCLQQERTARIELEKRLTLVESLLKE